jgi:hypothetical protein
MHWMFDRGLISIDDDLSILVARNRVPDTVGRLITLADVFVAQSVSIFAHIRISSPTIDGKSSKAEGRYPFVLSG